VQRHRIPDGDPAIRKKPFSADRNQKVSTITTDKKTMSVRRDNDCETRAQPAQERQCCLANLEKQYEACGIPLLSHGMETLAVTSSTTLWRYFDVDLDVARFLRPHMMGAFVLVDRTDQPGNRWGQHEMAQLFRQQCLEIMAWTVMAMRGFETIASMR
jgi:hypothetical protein